MTLANRGGVRIPANLLQTYFQKLLTSLGPVPAGLICGARKSVDDRNMLGAFCQPGRASHET